jgi:HEAT repeat protein
VCEVDAIDKLLTLLASEKTSSDAAFQLAGIPDSRAFHGLIAALKDTNPVIRNSSLLGLAERKDSAAAPFILDLLHDSEVYVRTSAAFALAKLCNSSCIPELRDSLKNSINVDAHLCRQLMIALMDICEENCVELIRIGLQSSIVRVRSTTAEFLGNIGNQSTILELSEQLLSETEESVKKSIEEAISELKRMTL